jgi:hypothetical protein
LTELVKSISSLFVQIRLCAPGVFCSLRGASSGGDSSEDSGAFLFFPDSSRYGEFITPASTLTTVYTALVSVTNGKQSAQAVTAIGTSWAGFSDDELTFLGTELAAVVAACSWHALLLTTCFELFSATDFISAASGSVDLLVLKY